MFILIDYIYIIGFSKEFLFFENVWEDWKQMLLNIHMYRYLGRFNATSIQSEDAWKVLRNRVLLHKKGVPANNLQNACF